MNTHTNYIDIHSHILPGVDDGSDSIEQTIEMLHMAAKEHITTIIATPHYKTCGDNPSVEALRALAEQVQEQANIINENFQIYLGNEIYIGEAYYDEAVIEALQSGKALTLADSSYVLVEFPYGIRIKDMYRAINKLIYNGYIPILAHIERYYRIHRDIHNIEELVKMGCYIQMNCASAMGGYFNRKASYNRRLINNGLVHFLASDSHCQSHRVPIMQSTVNELIRKCDAGSIEKICSDNPSHILKNTYI